MLAEFFCGVTGGEGQRQVFFTEHLEPPCRHVVYLAAMSTTSTVQTISIAGIGAYLRGTSQTLFCVVLVALSLVTIKPLMADMSRSAPGHAMMDMSQIACAEAACASSEHTMAAPGDCERDCTCCPGICSAYLPAVGLATVFSPLPTSAFTMQSGRRVATTSSLFRPPNFR